MDSSLKVINTSGTGCGTCGTNACESCSPAKPKPAPAVISRRDLARAAFFGGAAAMITGCSKTEDTHAKATPENSSVSENLAVVQKSKGPVMTMVDEFFKMG